MTRKRKSKIETVNYSVLSKRNEAEAELLLILSTKRTAWGNSEEYIIRNYLDTLPGMDWDTYGNRFVTIGPANPRIAFASHTDSVHTSDGVQSISMHGDTIALSPWSNSNCLGADCGTGLWIMRRMILAKVPGLYLFHRDEESGMQGSEFIARNRANMLDGIEVMLSLDRKGYDSIITHQMNERTASAAFALAMQSEFKRTGLPLMMPDAGGSYTDSYAYSGLVSECSNISIGYTGAHLHSEAQSLNHAKALLKSLCAFDWSKIVAKRDCTAVAEAHDLWSDKGDFGETWRSSIGYTRGNSAMADLCRDHADVVAEYLEDYGVNASDLIDYIYEKTGTLV